MFYPNGLTEDEKYKSIGGWLLFFCITLFISPVLYVFHLTISYKGFAPFFKEYQSYFIFFIISGIYYGLFMLFSLFTGFQLINKKSSAVKIAKIYLVTYCLGSILATSFPYLAGIPQEDVSYMFYDSLVGTLRIFIFSMVWLLYLSKLRRVKITYTTKE